MRALARTALLARPRARQLGATIALGAGAVLAAVALLAISGYLISRAALGVPILSLVVAIVAVRVCGMARAGLRYGERTTGHDLAFRVLADLRVRLYRRLASAAPGAAWRGGRGDLLSRFVADVESLQHVYLRGLAPPAVALVAGTLAVAAEALLLPVAGLVLAAGLILAGVGVPLLAGMLAAGAGRRQAPARGALTAELVEVLEGAPELAVAGREPEWAARVGRADAELAALARRDAVVEGLASGLTVALTGATVAAVVAVSIPAVRDGRIDGVLLAALGLLALAAFEAVAPLAPAARHLVASARAAERVEDVARCELVVAEPATPRPLPGDGELALVGVRARYGPDAPWVLDGADLRVAPGERVALAGPSGSGKSTLAHLLVRLRDPDAGRITVGGVDLRQAALHDVRDAVRLDAQDAHLFTATIAANVRVGHADATDADVVAALRRAGLEAWIAALPNGIETPVGNDGQEVSGGQRQRIALARALLSRARFLVLDEPGAHLDPVGARALHADLARLDDPRGILVITHTVAGTEGYDRVVRLEGGRTSVDA